MLKARSGNLIILGIDAENVRRLQEGKPILVGGRDLQIPVDVVIAYGETLDDIIKEFNLPHVN